MAVTSDRDDMSHSNKRNSKKKRQHSHGNYPSAILSVIPEGYKKIKFSNLEPSKSYENKTLLGKIWRTYPIIKRKTGFLRKLFITDAYGDDGKEQKKLTVFLFDKFAQDSEAAEPEGFIIIINFVTENLTQCPQDDNTLLPIQVLVMSDSCHVWFARKMPPSPSSESVKTPPKKKKPEKQVEKTVSPASPPKKKKLEKQAEKPVSPASSKCKKKSTRNSPAVEKPNDDLNGSAEDIQIDVPENPREERKKPSDDDVQILVEKSRNGLRTSKDDNYHISVEQSMDDPNASKDDNFHIISSMESPQREESPQEDDPEQSLTPTKRTIPYQYHKLNELETTDAEFNCNVYGMLERCNLKVVQGNNNRILELVLSDETDALFTCSVYGGKEDVFPDVHPGDVIRIHRVQVFKLRGKLRGKCFNPRFILVFSRNEYKITINTTAKNPTFAASDKQRVTELFKYAEKKSEPKLICEIKKGDSVNIICQVIGVYVAQTTDCVVVKIWDGTKSTEFESQHKGLPSERMDNALYIVAKPYFANLFVYGEHALAAGELNPGDCIEVRDAHLYVSKQEPYDATLRIQEGIKMDRGIKKLDLEDERGIQLKERLDKIIEDIRESGSQPELTLGESDSFFLNCDISALTSTQNAVTKEKTTESTAAESTAVKPRTPKDSKDLPPLKNNNVDHVEITEVPQKSYPTQKQLFVNITDFVKTAEKNVLINEPVPSEENIAPQMPEKNTVIIPTVIITDTGTLEQNPVPSSDLTGLKKFKTSGRIIQPKTFKDIIQPGTSKDATNYFQSKPGTSKDSTNYLQPQPGTSKDTANYLQPKPGTSKDPTSFITPVTSKDTRKESSNNQDGTSKQAENPFQSDYLIPSELQDTMDIEETETIKENPIVSVLSAGIKHGQSTQGFGEGLLRSALQRPSSTAPREPVQTGTATNATFLEQRVTLMENPTQLPVQFNFQNVFANTQNSTQDDWWKSVETVCETIGYDDVKPSSLSDVVQHDAPYKFRVFAVMLNFKPDTTSISSLIHLYCPSCSFLSEDANPTFRSFEVIDELPFYHCPECSRKGAKIVLEYTFLISFSLHDGTDPSFIEAYLWRQNAVNFFKGITPEEALRNTDAINPIFDMLYTICPNCRPLDVPQPPGNADWQSYPTLDCCILSYTAASGGGTRYQIFDTRLK